MRVGVGVIVTLVLWWLGVRFLGVSLLPQDFGGAFSSGVWVAFIGMVWAYILGLPAMAWVVEKVVGGLYTPADSQFRIRPEHSIAEGHAAAGRYREAIEQFRRDIEKFPDEVTPHVRIADIAVERLGDVETAIAELRAGLPKTTSGDGFALVSHRLAEVLVQYRRDTASAIEVLREIERRYPHSKHALGARNRIERLTGE